VSGEGRGGGADFDDVTCTLEAEDGGSARRGWVTTFTLRDVSTVETECTHSDEDMIVLVSDTAKGWSERLVA
jgi:hypothetical protein